MPTDKITSIAEFVQLLWEREAIKKDSVTKLQELAKLCNRPTFFNKYCRRQNIPLIPLGKRKKYFCVLLYVHNMIFLCL